MHRLCTHTTIAYHSGLGGYLTCEAGEWMVWIGGTPAAYTDQQHKRMFPRENRMHR